jgi:hypothetical protein|tara:strand:+ start:829 stop:1314 length:486 start_codon:yes stop_codon:yes gene_type:complete
MSFKIIDNYLSKENHLILTSVLEETNFPWFFCNKVIGGEPKNLFNMQFHHTFYNDDKVNSHFFNCIDPIIKKLKPLSLIRVKVNITPISHNLVKYETHVDQTFKCKVGIYYVNDNNGYTIIEGKKIKSKKNRMVLFTSDIEHYGTNSTDCRNRMVINFNYF